MTALSPKASMTLRNLKYHGKAYKDWIGLIGNKSGLPSRKAINDLLNELGYDVTKTRNDRSHTDQNSFSKNGVEIFSMGTGYKNHFFQFVWAVIKELDSVECPIEHCSCGAELHIFDQSDKPCGSCLLKL